MTISPVECTYCCKYRLYDPMLNPITEYLLTFRLRKPSRDEPSKNEESFFKTLSSSKSATPHSGDFDVNMTSQRVGVLHIVIFPENLFLVTFLSPGESSSIHGFSVVVNAYTPLCSSSFVLGV